MKLLLDEHYPKRIAELLRERGHDVISVKERPDLEGMRDEELFSLMQAEQRAIMTENWADYDRQLRRAADEGAVHYGVLFTSRHQLPRSRRTIGLYVRVLDDLLGCHLAVDAILNSTRWLPDRPIT